MRRLILAAAGAMALVGGVANAAAVVSDAVGPLPPAVNTPGTFIIGSNLSVGPGMFSDTFTFTLLSATPSLLNGQVSSQEFTPGQQNIDFSTFLVDGMDGYFSKTSSDPKPETFAILNPILLDPGEHTITVGGTLKGEVGSYVGNFNVQAPVPESKTWAMMLLGFGAMGIAIRRRRKPVFAQIA